MGMDNYIKGERFGTFPGISAGYILSNEDFLKDNKAISQIKIRGSWGMAGNERTRARRYPYTDIYTAGNGYTFGGLNNVYYPGYVESEAGNKLIKWETSAMTNIGLDLSFWNNALYANIDVFKEHRWGILTNRNTIPTLYGQTPPLDAFGEVSNQGGEILIGTDLKSGDLHFNVSVSGSAAFNKILQMDEVTPPEEYQVLTGRPIGQVLGYKFVKFFDSYEEIANSPVQELGTANLKPGNIKWADINGDNLVNVNDRTYIGNVDIPKFVMGSNIRISWKGFEIYALLYGEFQRSVVVGADLVEHSLQWGGKTLPEVRKSWGYYSLDPNDPTNINAKYPRITADNTRYANDHQYTSNTTNIQYESDKWFVNGDFIRLRNVEFAYTLPTKWTEKIKISNLRIFVNGYNLLVWDHIKLLDPETTANFLWGYPKTKAINFGFNITF
jgi:TonB-linked SusC/RagA family outer membrane protein